MSDSEPTNRRDADAPRRRQVRPNVIFAAPLGDPRTRRASDVMLVVTSLVVSLLAAWTHAAPSDFDRRVSGFFDAGLPGWVSATCTAIFVLGGLYVLVFLGAIALFAHGRRSVARDMALAGVIAVCGVTLLSLLAGSEWPDIIPELLERNDGPSFPVVRIAFAVALHRVSLPYLTVPMRRLGRQLVLPMAAAAVVLNYGSVSGVIGGYAVGVGAAATIHLLFGSGVGIPGPQRIVDSVESLRLDPVSLEYIDEPSLDATLVRASTVEGRGLLLKVYGRDTVNAETASRIWRSVWYRGDLDAVRATRFQQVEHESLMLLEVARSGGPAPELVGWGRGAAGDAVIAVEKIEGEPLGSLGAERVDDEMLARCWQALDRLSDANIAHRAIDPRRLVVQADRVVFDDFSSSQIAPDPLTRVTDVAQMLVATAVVVGPERAIDAARSTVSSDLLVESLAVLQRSALSDSLRRDVRAAKLDLKHLRNQLAEALDTDAPELVKLARVTWANVAMVALTFFAAYALISSLADIGLGTVVDEFDGAAWSWIVVALMLAQLTNVGEYLSLTGLVDRPVPLGPALMVRYAISFVSLAVPSEAGAIAMNVRYMQRLGVSAPAAVAQGPLLTVVSKGLDILLLVITSRIVGQTVGLDDLDSGPLRNLLLLLVVLVMVALVTIAAVPQLRRRVVPPVKEALSAVRGAITDPARLVRILGGSLMTRFLFAMTLAAAAAAFGGSVGFSEALFVNSAVSLFVGLMPVPGGIGVGEAALTTGLVAVGVPEGAALAAAVTHRMVTSYMPPVFGWYATRWLTARDYL